MSAPVPAVDAPLVHDWKAAIAEAPVWDERGQVFWCLDNVSGEIIALESDWSVRWTIRRGRPTAAALPRRSGGLLLAEGCAFTLFDADGGERPLTTIDADPSSVRINEAACDPQGRVWAGTVDAALSLGGGALYRLDGDGRCARVLEGLTIGNGMGWSPDGAIFYLVDSPTGRVDAFDFDGAAGTLANRRTVLNFAVGEGWADGLCVDAEGCLWVAIPLTSEVRRYSPGGALLLRVRVAAPFVTSCAFGGADHATLLITTGAVALPRQMVAAIGFDPDAAEGTATAPGAGGLFALRPGATGLAEPACGF
ncbi:SMP-30/gluconolactonase/LRE family protein [Rhizorhabdus histidinilytica]|uniref:SMP-30/gluconolactonase/LRE family protein n=1 Tax=Rhizorhabdus histidinilytica TaxID=439228 RepID=UPI00321FA65B